MNKIFRNRKHYKIFMNDKLHLARGISNQDLLTFSFRELWTLVSTPRSSNLHIFDLFSKDVLQVQCLTGKTLYLR